MLSQANLNPHMHSEFVYSGIGCDLSIYQLNSELAGIELKWRLQLPSKIQYAWRHSAKPFLYVACSNGSPNAQGDTHCVVTIALDDPLKGPYFYGNTVQLPARPIHITLDQLSRYALIAYNNPSSLTMHPIHSDGAIADAITPIQPVKTGIYAHQTMVSPSNSVVVVVARGNNPKGNHPEDPGSLEVFSYESGQLQPTVSVAPDGGYGFGPRHVDFHPTKPWLYVSLERQNTLHMFDYDLAHQTVSPKPSFVCSTLHEPDRERPRQRPGTIHVHPNGATVYVANRASGEQLLSEETVFIGGENNIAVFRIDPITGEPKPIQFVDTLGIVPRTFSLNKKGSILIAANSVSMKGKGSARISVIPASLCVFKVNEDGTLVFNQKIDVDASLDPLFWMSIVAH